MFWGAVLRRLGLWLCDQRGRVVGVFRDRLEIMAEESCGSLDRVLVLICQWTRDAAGGFQRYYKEEYISTAIICVSLVLTA